jgi:hypothetical protein
MNFGFIFFTVVDPIIVYIKIFFSIFLKLLNIIFEFFEKMGYMDPRAPFDVFGGCTS